MASSMKFLCILGLILLVGTVVDGVGECGRSSPDIVAFKLVPCAGAANDANVAMPGSCCAQINTLTMNPKCLCAILLSDTAKSLGIKPEIGITFPKRCKFANRPVGYKCGLYTLP